MPAVGRKWRRKWLRDSYIPEDGRPVHVTGVPRSRGSDGFPDLMPPRAGPSSTWWCTPPIKKNKKLPRQQGPAIGSTPEPVNHSAAKEMTREKKETPDQAVAEGSSPPVVSVRPLVPRLLHMARPCP